MVVAVAPAASAASADNHHHQQQQQQHHHHHHHQHHHQHHHHHHRHHHEHHHHHHHNTEDEENGDNVTSSSQQEYSESSAGETPSTSESLLNNIVNDKVLYDFVSFLLDQQAKKLKEPRPERRSQEIDIESYYHHTPVKQEIVAVDHEIEKFLADGFTPIVEIELE